MFSKYFDSLKETVELVWLQETALSTPFNWFKGPGMPAHGDFWEQEKGRARRDRAPPIPFLVDKCN